jgi:hypothetical protein
MRYWKTNEEKTEDIWLELECPNGWYKASVKWDGCVDFYRLHNKPLPITEEHPQMVDYVHFCDIDEEIKRLTELKNKAIAFFGEDWE